MHLQFSDNQCFENMAEMSAFPHRESTFERTLRDFKKSLSPEQQKEFAGTTLKDLQIAITAIQEKQKATRTNQNLRRIEGFLEAMEANAKIIDVFINVHSFVAFIWVRSNLNICHLYQANSA